MKSINTTYTHSLVAVYRTSGWTWVRNLLLFFSQKQDYRHTQKSSPGRTWSRLIAMEFGYDPDFSVKLRILPQLILWGGCPRKIKRLNYDLYVWRKFNHPVWKVTWGSDDSESYLEKRFELDGKIWMGNRQCSLNVPAVPFKTARRHVNESNKTISSLIITP